jgi:hypothetical protein
MGRSPSPGLRRTKRGRIRGAGGKERVYLSASVKVYSWFSRARGLKRYNSFFYNNRV